ncbi:unnamed protein product [Camellia sinensis]
MSKRAMAIPQVIIELQDQALRESTLRCLSTFLLEGVTEEVVNEGEKNVASEKPAGEEETTDVNKENPANEVAEEKEPEEKEMTLEEYEKVLEEKRKALLALKTEERKGSDKDKRKELSVSINEFLKPAGDRYYSPDTRGRGGRGRDSRGGYGGGGDSRGGYGGVGANAYGVTMDSQIGIDVEEKQRTIRNDILSFARRYFSHDEMDFLAAISDPEVQRQEFIKL